MEARAGRWLEEGGGQNRSRWARDSCSLPLKIGSKEGAKTRHESRASAYVKGVSCVRRDKVVPITEVGVFLDRGRGMVGVVRRRVVVVVHGVCVLSGERVDSVVIGNKGRALAVASCLGVPVTAVAVLVWTRGSEGQDEGDKGENEMSHRAS